MSTIAFCTLTNAQYYLIYFQTAGKMTSGVLAGQLDPKKTGGYYSHQIVDTRPSEF